MYVYPNTLLDPEDEDTKSFEVLCAICLTAQGNISEDLMF
jgi:hypothetical protein